MIRPPFVAILSAIVALTFPGPTSANSFSFQGVGDLPGGTVSSVAFGVSADGSTVVGWSISANGQEAYRWTRGGGMVGLGDLPGGNFNSSANGVSSDGSAIIGLGKNMANAQEAFRWTASYRISRTRRFARWRVQ